MSMYVILEGIDTAGKSTQLQKLQTIFTDAVFTKEPGGTTLGTKLRHMILHEGVKAKATEMFLFLADRAEHYALIVKENPNKLIISDRSLISGIAYALVAKDFQESFLFEANKLALNNELPQKAILLKLTKEALEFRLSQKEHDVIEQRGSAYLLEIQDAMEYALEKLGINTLIVDATQSIEAIHTQILEFIKA